MILPVPTEFKMPTRPGPKQNRPVVARTDSSQSIERVPPGSSGRLQAWPAAVEAELNIARRRSNVSGHTFTRDNIRAEDQQNLDRIATVLHSSLDDDHDKFKVASYTIPVISRPEAAKSGPVTTIREMPSEYNSKYNSPLSTRPPSPTTELSRRLVPLQADESMPVVAETYPDIGSLKSWKGIMVLIITCGSQLLDNVFMTGVNIALPAIQREFQVKSGDLQWMLSAYTLTFGGFMLLAGGLSDRYGRKFIFCAGMFWISVWTLANGFGTSFMSLVIFRALQGIGAAMTVPSSVGIISSYFVVKDRTMALTIFAASGAVGFCSGLIFGGFLTSSLGWRYLFRVSVALTGTLTILGFMILPKDRKDGSEKQKPRLDYIGAALSTGGLIILSFVLSGGGVYGWNKAFIIVLLISSIAMLATFTWVERKVANPIMPVSLWKIQNFAGLWIAGFVTYGSYQIVIYYIVLMAQEVNKLSSGQTALRFLPMGFMGFATSMVMSKIVEKVDTKKVLLTGLGICMIAPIPSAIVKEGNINFWQHVLPTSLLVVCGVTIVYCSCTIILLASVPLSLKSLCGGMINTAFQIGSGVGLALASAIVTAVDVDKGRTIIEQYTTGLWCCVGFAAIGFFASLFGVKSVTPSAGGGGPIALH